MDFDQQRSFCERAHQNVERVQISVAQIFLVFCSKKDEAVR